MKPGIFRLAMLFITGRSRAWYQYLVGALLVALFLLSIFAGRRSGDFTLAMAMAVLFNVVLWCTGTIGMIATVRELRGLRAPHVYRKARMVLGLAALLTLIVPAVLLLFSQGAASGPDAIHLSFMMPTLGATAGMLVALLPLPIVSAVLVLGPLTLFIFPGVGPQLMHTALWQSAWRLEAIALPALCIVVWRSRAVILAETAAGVAWWSLAQMRVIASNPFMGAAQDPNVVYRIYPAWMTPSWRTRAGASLWTRISTLMGSPFTPGSLRQMLLVLGVIGGIGAVAVWYFAQQFPVRMQQALLAVMTSEVPLAFIIMLLSISRTYAGRLRMIHRPQSADLAELALLPGLGVGRTPLANYCLVLFGRPLRMIAVVTVVLGGAMAVVAHSTSWSPLLLVLIVAGLVLMEIARYLAIGRPIFQNIQFEAFGFAAVLMAASVVATRALADFGPRAPSISVGTSNVISHAVLPALAVIVCLVTIQVGRWAYATAARLPHPFLDAQERRVLR